ncbi:E3 ubiquitin-protein ligase hel2 [Staphylotrichum tortipilum]|uniref:RING-type E3 ubiquitin transferase n=1 Tax=Staphylotrichum tortipilum TaxID=2831512 RepID=A0AAN6MGQ4_9PEZI|nr:E3 ubiquitin-protein ligase hel2 [Staphylotrichum longicolle]
MASTGPAAPATGGGAPSGPRADGARARARGRGGRGRGRGGRGRGGGGGGGGGQPQHSAQDQPAEPPAAAGDDAKPAAQPPSRTQHFKVKHDTQDQAADDDVEVCFICANPVSHYSVAPCNHISCHICALRLRALYKNKDCPHCRTSSPYVIFTDDGTKRFEEYTDAEITSTDDNIGIKYAGEDIVGDTVLLLRYNCPDADCDFAGLGWQDLHRHVRSVHHMKMCDLCTRNKKVFTHEHDMFADKDLTEHMRHGDDKPGTADQTGFRGHPLCGFCGARFYDSDKLYEHCRNKHERCFLCDRRDSRQPHYYLDYPALEAHFKKDHFICSDRECLEKKFVVFESEMDLKAHQLSEHGGSFAKGRDARTVDLSNFDLRQRYEQERRGGGGGGGGRDQQRRRGPDASAEPLPVSSAQPLRRDQLAFQRQMALQSSASQPSAPAGPSRPTQGNAAAQAQSRIPADRAIIDAMENISVSDLSSLTPEQRASLTRHGAVIERAANLLGNDPSKMATFRAHISTYNKGSMKPEQLIDAFFALFSETSSNALGTLVREVADLFQDPKKAEVLRKAWQNWRAINEDYPSLPGLDGMHGATTSTTGWAAAAAASASSGIAGYGTPSQQAAAAALRNSTRVLKLKNSTRRNSIGGQSVLSIASSASASVPGSFAGQTAGGAGPSRPAASQAAFPALPGANRSQQPQSTSWIGGRGSGGGGTTTATKAGGGGGAIGGGGGRKQGGLSSEDAFPALPAAPKPQTTIFGYGRGAVRRDFGGARETGFSWGGGSASGTQGQQGEAEGGDGGSGAGQGKKKKKQVLAHWG